MTKLPTNCYTPQVEQRVETPEKLPGPMGPPSSAPDFLDIDEFEHRLEVNQRKVDDHPEPIK